MSGGSVQAGVDGLLVGGVNLRGSSLNVSAYVSVSPDPIGNSLEVLYAGQAPYLVAGLMQVNFRLPTTFTLGVAQPVYVVLQIGTVFTPPVAVYVKE